MKKLFAFLALLVAWLAAPPLANADLYFYDANYGTSLSGSGNVMAHMYGTSGDYVSDSWNSSDTEMVPLGNNGYVYYYTPTENKTSDVIFHKSDGSGDTKQSNTHTVGDGKMYRYYEDCGTGRVTIKLRGTPDNSNWDDYATLSYNSDNGTFETDGFVTFNNVNLVTAGFNVYMWGNDRGWFGVSEINGPMTDQTMSPLGHMSVNLNGKYKLIIDFKNAHGSTGNLKLSVIEETTPSVTYTLTSLHLVDGNDVETLMSGNALSLSDLTGAEKYRIKAVVTDSDNNSTTKYYYVSTGALTSAAQSYNLAESDNKTSKVITLLPNVKNATLTVTVDETTKNPVSVAVSEIVRQDVSYKYYLDYTATDWTNPVLHIFADGKAAVDIAGVSVANADGKKIYRYDVVSDWDVINGVFHQGWDNKNQTEDIKPLTDGAIYVASGGSNEKKHSVTKTDNYTEPTLTYSYKIKYGINNQDGWTPIDMTETSPGVWETINLTFDGTAKNFGVKEYLNGNEVSGSNSWWCLSSAQTVDNSNYSTDLTLVSGGSVNPTWALDGQFKLSFNANTGALTVTGTPNTISKVELYEGETLKETLYDGSTYKTYTVSITDPETSTNTKSYKLKVTPAHGDARWYKHDGDIVVNGKYAAAKGASTDATTFKSFYSAKIGVADLSGMAMNLQLTEADNVIYVYTNADNWTHKLGALTKSGSTYSGAFDIPFDENHPTYFAMSTNPAPTKYEDFYIVGKNYERFAPNGADVTLTAAGFPLTVCKDSPDGSWKGGAGLDRYTITVDKSEITKPKVSVMPHIHNLALQRKSGDTWAAAGSLSPLAINETDKFRVQDKVTLGNASGATVAETKYYGLADAIDTNDDKTLTEGDAQTLNFVDKAYRATVALSREADKSIKMTVTGLKFEGYYPIMEGSTESSNHKLDKGETSDGITKYTLYNKYDNRGEEQTRYFVPDIPASPSPAGPRYAGAVTVPAGVYTKFTTTTIKDDAVLSISADFIVSAEWDETTGQPKKLIVTDPDAMPELYFYGAAHGWSNTEPLRFAKNKVNQTYTIAVKTNGGDNPELGFKIATAKGEWVADINPATYSYNDDSGNKGGLALNTDLAIHRYVSGENNYKENMYLPAKDKIYYITISNLTESSATMRVSEGQAPGVRIFGSFNHTGSSSTGTEWSDFPNYMDFDGTYYTYTYTTKSSTNPFLFRIYDGSDNYGAPTVDRTPLYDEFVKMDANNVRSYEVQNLGERQKIVITFNLANKNVKSNIVNALPSDVAYRSLPVMPYVVRKSNADNPWDAWTNDEPVVYVMGKYVNNNRIVPDWELLPQGDGTYKLSNVALRGVDATNIKALVIYKDQATPQEYTISFPNPNGLETEDNLNYGRSYDLEYNNESHTFIATPTANSKELPFVSLNGHSYRQLSDEMTPGGVTTTEGGWTEGWVLYGENKQPLRDLRGNYIYSTQWPPRNTIYFKAVRGDESFDWPSDKLIFKPQRSGNALTVMDATAWETSMKERDDQAYEKLDLVDGQKYARYVISDTWLLGATKIWTGWASAFFNKNGPYPEWAKHMNWGVPNSSTENAGSGRSVAPYTTIDLVNGETTGQGNFFLENPTYFKTVEFYLPVLEDGTPDRSNVNNARLYTTMALAEAKIDAKADKIGEGTDNNTGAFRVRYDEAKTSLTLQSWKVTRYSADLTKDMDNSENWVEAIANDDENAVLVYKSIKEEDEALGATVVATQDALKTGLDATNSSASAYTKESVTLPNGRYFYGLEITFTDGTNTYKETIPSAIFTLTTLDAEPACTPLQLVLIKDEDNVKANSIVKPYAGKYLTYRPKRNGTYYIVDEADNTAEPLDAAEADKVIKALVADPMLFTWTADYYVFAFDYSDYEESMTQAQKAGKIVKFNKNPQVEIYNLPVVYDTHGNMVTNPDDIATLNTNADNAAEGWITCKKTNSTGYYGFVVKSHGKLEPMYYRGRVKYDYTVNEGDAPAQKVAAVNGSLRPTMPQPFGLKFEYQTPESSEVASGINSEVTVHTTSSILPKLDGNGNLDVEDGIVKRREVDVKFPWNGEGTSYFSPRDLNCVIEFIQPNVCYEIMENYHIRYDVVISNDYTMSNPDFYNPQTGVWTAPTQDQLNADKKLLYQRAYYYDEEIDDTGDVPYRFVINNVSPTDQINPVFQIVNVLYTNKTKADLTANYFYTPLKLVCNSTFTGHKAPDYDKIYLQARENQLGGYDWFYYGHVDKTEGSSQIGVDDDNSNTNTKMIPSMYHFEAFIKDTNDEGIMKRTDGAQNTNLHLDLDYYYGGFREVMYHNTDDHTCALVENSALPADPLIGKCILANAPKDRALEVRITPIFVFKRHPEGEASDEADVIGLVKEGTSGQQSAPRYVNAAPAGTPEYVVMRGESFEKNTNDTEMFPGTTGLENLNGYDDAEPEYYNIQGMRITEPKAGEVYIVRRGGKVTKELMR